MIDNDRIIPPLHGVNSNTVEFPSSVEVQLVGQITTEYRKYGLAGVQELETVDVDPIENVDFQDPTDFTVKITNTDKLILDPLDTAYNQGVSQNRLSSLAVSSGGDEKSTYKSLKQRIRRIKDYRSKFDKASEEYTNLTKRLHTLSRKYQCEKAQMKLDGELGFDSKTRQAIQTPLLCKLRQNDKQWIQPHLLGCSSYDIRITDMNYGDDTEHYSKQRSKNKYISPSRNNSKIVAFARGVRSACIRVNISLLNFFSVDNILCNVEADTLKTHKLSTQFSLRHPQGLSAEQKQNNAEKLRTIEFFQQLVSSQNYQLFKEESLSVDHRAHALTRGFRQQSRQLLEAIFQERETKSLDLQY